jgi:probable HAF family extracellular repeat protein
MKMISANVTMFHRRAIAAIVAAVIFTAIAVASAAPAWTASEVPASKAAPSGSDRSAASHKNGNDVGLRGHGFVADNGRFTTIDARRAGAFTVVVGRDERGRTAGGYVDDRGRLHGFLKDGEDFTVIDFPGAAATFVSRLNSQGQIVGTYGDRTDAVAADLPHGFLLDNGVFTKIDVPDAVQTQPFGINNRGQIVGSYVDAAGRSHGFQLDDGGLHDDRRSRRRGDRRLRYR